MKAPFVIIALCLFAPAAYPWSDHASLAWPLVRSLPELNRAELNAESLADFLLAESEAVAATLQAQEAWSVANIKHYAETPGDLAFGSAADLSSAEGEELVTQFLAAIRVNPGLPYRLYRARNVEDIADPVTGVLRWDDLSFLEPGASHATAEYVALQAGEWVSPAQVLASASDEPDFGMDIGLFEDNGTEFGQRYGFGAQPFGNPNLDYGSQAPFHMGFYHLDWLTRTVQPSLLRTYPQWRIALYQRLATTAFETGHHYWGWRFMGWALHYIGDLTQPYHAVPLPGVSTVDALWSVARGKTGEAIQLVSNRHGVLESYQYQRVMRAQVNRGWGSPLLSAIRGGETAARLTVEQVVEELARESTAAAADLDAALTTWVPAEFVSDPSFEWTGSGYEASVVDEIRRQGGERAVAMLDEMLTSQLSRFAYYARAWTNTALETVARMPTPMPVRFSMLDSLSTPDVVDEQAYGSHASQRLFQVRTATSGDASPESTAQPLLVVHGGCWMSAYDYQHVLPMAAALDGAGFGVWVAEYRRTGEDGGGWPGSLEDVVTAITTVAESAGQPPIVVGHSAGGHLALLAALERPASVDRVVALAPITDLESYGAQEGSCQSQVSVLMAEVADADREAVHDQASPARRAPTVPVLLVRGGKDRIVGADQADAMLKYGEVQQITIPEAGHFDLIHPKTAAFETWLSALPEGAE